MKVKSKMVVCYKKHSISSNGSINLELKTGYDNITNAIGLLQMLNNDVRIKVMIPDTKKKYDLGLFRIKSIVFNGDGESDIKFNSIDDFVEVNNLNEIITKEPFIALFSADVELEGEEGEEN